MHKALACNVRRKAENLSKISARDHEPVLLERVDHQRAVALHARREDDQLEPLATDVQEEVNVRTLIHGKPHVVSIESNLKFTPNLCIFSTQFIYFLVLLLFN